MANQSEPIRREIERLYRRVEEEITDALRRGQASGTVRSDVDPREVALFFVATTQGMMGLTKTYQDTGMPEVIGQALIKHLEGLRPRST